MTPLVGLNLVTDLAFVSAIKPLFTDHLVEAIEWDIDAPWVVGRQALKLPSWIERLLDLYASDGRLYGHGVWLSMLTAHPQARQAAWLERLASECARRPYRHISEHLGFMSAGPYIINTLLPVPYVSAAVSTGRDRLVQFAEATGTTVGLENMAAALAPADATAQAALLDDILAPVDGFCLLDVHNVFTQAANLGLDPLALLATFPCDRVREIHVSGGRWVNIDEQPYRFDGHNGSVPPEVFSLVTTALSYCPHVEVVIFERRDSTIDSEADIVELQADYRRLVEVVRAADRPEWADVPRALPLACKPVVAMEALALPHELAHYQDALVEVLASKGTPQALQGRLLAHPASQPVRDYIASFVPRCIAATSLLVRRWAKTEAELADNGIVPNVM
jgi:uncharacterized protein (UPF0276 family)